MAISIGSIGATATGANVTSLNVAYPSPIAADDLMVLFVTLTDDIVNLPSGWTSVYKKDTAPQGLLAIKKATGSESGNLTLTLGESNIKACIIAYKGVHTTTPEDATATNVTGTGTSVVCPSITIATAGAWLVFVSGAGAGTTTHTAPSPAVERKDHAAAPPGALYDEALAGTGASGTRTITRSTSAAFWGAMLALRPAPAGGPITVVLGLATETDSGLASTRIKRQDVGLPVEADSGLTSARLKRRTTGLPTEANSALPLSRVSIRVTGLATETDTALAVGRISRLTTGFATETDSTPAALRIHSRSTGLPTELDLALSPRRQKQRLLGLAVEQDIALGGLAPLPSINLPAAATISLRTSAAVLAPFVTGALIESSFSAVALEQHASSATVPVVATDANAEPHGSLVEITNG